MPFLYNACVLFAFLYGLVSYWRAWISKEEGKISMRALRWLGVAYAYFAFSTMLFATVFAVSPDPAVPVTMVIHSFPS